MTVINAMKFNDKSGGMVADSQASSTFPPRKYDLAEKVHQYRTDQGLVVLFGGTGASDILDEATCKLLKTLKAVQQSKENVTVDTTAKLTSAIMLDMKRERVDSYVKSRFGITRRDALGGVSSVDGEPVRIGEHLLSRITESYMADSREAMERFHNAFLLVGRDTSGVSLYAIPMGSAPSLVMNPYWSVGSGSDESDRVLYHFVHGLPREKRSNIDFASGMQALIRATNASSDINIGVGGVPTIAYFDDNGITVLDEDSSRLSAHVVRVAEVGLITPDCVHASLEKLLYKKDTWEKVHDEAFKGQNYDKIMKFLLGYRL